MKTKHKAAKARNLIALDLYSGKYKPKVVPAKKGKGSKYNRNTKHRGKNFSKEEQASVF